MIIGDEIVRRVLGQSTTIDYQTKILLRYITHTSLHVCSHLCHLSAINMSLLNDMEQVIEDLPDQFYSTKIKLKNLIKSFILYGLSFTTISHNLIAIFCFHLLLGY